MPKKGVNEKAEAARERKAEAKSAAKDKASKDAEDAYWRAAGEGAGKAAARKEEEERRRAEQAAKRAELKRLQEEEERALASATKTKVAPAGSQKITKFQLDKQREIEEQVKAEQMKEKALSMKREMDEGSYERLVLHENTNRADGDAVEARSVEGALAALGIADPAAEDKHPEKRMKAAWKAFEAATLISLKEEKPGLKMSQYKDLIWKLWQKSPDNPLNKAALAAGSTSKA